jgi:hypothetical protein
LIKLRTASEGDEAPMVDAMAEEGEEARGHLIALYVAKTWVISQKTANTEKIARELKEKDEATKSSETPNHVFHNTSHEMVNNQGYGNPYMARIATLPKTLDFRMDITNIHI